MIFYHMDLQNYKKFKVKSNCDPTECKKKLEAEISEMESHKFKAEERPKSFF